LAGNAAVEASAVVDRARAISKQKMISGKRNRMFINELIENIIIGVLRTVLYNQKEVL
jgi:hypothetical protein